MSIGTQNREEQLSLALRELYEGYGYAPYKMSKFEEYDLYLRNKSFLLSDRVITFTDTNGRLMALKPDVTLSIVKNSEDVPCGFVKKLYYTESVYRISESTHAWREISQTGLECLGDVDEYQLSEVLSLALKTLSLISPDHVLDVSHLGLLSLAMDRAGVCEEDRGQLLEYVSKKNRHDLAALLSRRGIVGERVDALLSLCLLSGTPKEALPVLRSLYADAEWQRETERFEALLSPLPTSHLRIDFSVIHDLSYYNGIVFQGFVAGVPERVLSGGQYDRLMEKMGKRACAIGFAVYPESLESLGAKKDFDTDVLLLYSESTDLLVLSRTVELLSANGERVTAQRSVPDKITYRKLLKMTEGGVILLEEHA